MNEETRLLVDAISSLKQEPSYFRDYIFPIVSAFFSAILGAAVAYFTLKWQEKIQIEKGKMDIANKWILVADEARSNLISLKQNYHGRLNSDNPFKRTCLIPTILIDDGPIAVEYHELSFIVPQMSPDGTTYPKWSQIPRIRTMIGNYNQVLFMWKQRNILNEEFKEKIIAQYGDTAMNGFSIEQAVAAVGQPFLVRFIDITERLVKLTDDLIVELNDFLENFPSYAKSKIQHERLKEYGSVHTYSNNNNKFILEILKKSPEANFSKLEGLFGEPHEVIISRHQTGYEK